MNSGAIAGLVNESGQLAYVAFGAYTSNSSSSSTSSSAHCPLVCEVRAKSFLPADDRELLHVNWLSWDNSDSLLSRGILKRQQSDKGGKCIDDSIHCRARVFLQ